MAYLGKVPAAVPIDASDIPDNSITSVKIKDGVITIDDIGADAVGTSEIADDAVTEAKLDNAINTAISDNTAKTGITSGQASAITTNTAKVTNATHTGDVTGATALTIADNAVTLAKMAGGTDGELITYDTAGDPAKVAVGTSGHVLTSGGAGVAPTFQAAAGGVDGITSSADATAITIDARENVGIGATPSTAWHTGMNALEFDTGAISSGVENTGDDTIAFTSNAYYDNTNNRWQHRATGACCMIRMKDGEIDINTAASKAADSQVAWSGGNAYPPTGAGFRMYTAGGYGSKFSFDTSDAIASGAKMAISYHGWQESSGIKLYDEYSNVNNYNIARLSFHTENGEIGKITTTSNSTTYSTSSDYRLKENVEPMTGAIDRLKGLKPSRFNFKISPDDILLDGFLAHEVSAYVPEAITGEKDGMAVETKYTADDIETQGATPTKEIGDAKTYSTTKIDAQTIDQSKLVPLLVGALQEAVARIEALENQ